MEAFKNAAPSTCAALPLGTKLITSTCVVAFDLSPLCDTPFCDVRLNPQLTQASALARITGIWLELGPEAQGAMAKVKKQNLKTKAAKAPSLATERHGPARPAVSFG